MPRFEICLSCIICHNEQVVASNCITVIMIQRLHQKTAAGRLHYVFVRSEQVCFRHGSAVVPAEPDVRRAGLHFFPHPQAWMELLHAHRVLTC